MTSRTLPATLRALLITGVLGLLASSLSGCCEPAFDHVEIVTVADSTGFASVDTSHISLAIGVVVRVKFRAINEDGGDMPGNFTFQADPDAPFRALADFDPDTVVLVGETVTDQPSPLHLLRDGRQVLAIPTTVHDQR